MTIDLSKAPEGATHYAEGEPGMNIAVWYKDVTPHSCEWMNFGRSSDWQRSNKAPIYPIKPIHAAQWDGVGLPPVGTVCVIQDRNPHATYEKHVGLPATILAHDVAPDGMSVAVYRVDLQDGSWAYHSLVKERFTPVRTPELIEAEERDKGIRELSAFMAPANNYASAAERLYDAGVRLPGVAK